MMVIVIISILLVRSEVLASLICTLIWSRDPLSEGMKLELLKITTISYSSFHFIFHYPKIPKYNRMLSQHEVAHLVEHNGPEPRNAWRDP